MTRSSAAALVFAGDSPGSWWVVHAGRPRFAARLLSREDFNAEPRYAALLPHGLSEPLPVHFTLGADVLVVTDFIDPVTLAEGVSPQQAILSDEMLDALHACSRAIIRIARRDPEFARLAERAEQFLVGWQVNGRDDDQLDLLHATGAQVQVTRDADGDCRIELLQAPGEDACHGWAPALLHDRLRRIGGERGCWLLEHGTERLPAADGGALSLDDFAEAARQTPPSLFWRAVNADGVCYAALECRHAGPTTLCRLAVEIDGGSALAGAPQLLAAGDGEAILELVPSYGLEGAVTLLAAWRHAWYENAIDAQPAADAATDPLPYYPCEVELLAEGECYPAIAFGPPAASGRHRLVIAPHGAAPGNDSSLLLAYECVEADRRQFHLPRYL
jgi:hypothetical protein